MTDYVILRASKLKTLGGLAAASRHQTRDRPTQNADPAGAVLVALGSGNPEQDVRKRLADLPKPPRKNAVLAIEVLLTASPSWWRPHDPAAAGVYDERRIGPWTQVAIDWLQEEFGTANIVSVQVHCDEATPHAHCLVVPVDDSPSAKGKAAGPRLNAARWLDGADRLSQMQDSAAASFAHLGLERGCRRSRATHQAVRAWYAAQDKAAAIAKRVLDHACRLTGLLNEREQTEMKRFQSMVGTVPRMRRQPSLGAR